MDKLNNEELNKVSAGAADDQVPGLEWMELWLHNHGGHCKHCGTPVTEFQALSGPLKAGSWYEYNFLCKCTPSLRARRTLYWDPKTAQVINDSTIVQ